MKRAEKLMKQMTFELEDDLVAYITEGCAIDWLVWVSEEVDE
jgi:hypothetical protein